MNERENSSRLVLTGGAENVEIAKNDNPPISHAQIFFFEKEKIIPRRHADPSRKPAAICSEGTLTGAQRRGEKNKCFKKGQR